MRLTNYERALAVDPANPIAHTDRGVALSLLDRFEEALASHEEALRIEPHIVGAHVNRGNAMLKLARLQEALGAYTEALARDPVNSEANFNAALTRLCMGDYREGWKQYEHRWETKHFAGHRPTYPQPMWCGEDIAGKRIVLNAEQGMGDVIQFVRYAPLVAAARRRSHPGGAARAYGTDGNCAWRFARGARMAMRCPISICTAR